MTAIRIGYLEPLQQRRNATTSIETALPLTGWTNGALFHEVAMGVAVRRRTRRKISVARVSILQDESELAGAPLQKTLLWLAPQISVVMNMWESCCNS
jgi:hypothetical protein